MNSTFLKAKNPVVLVSSLANKEAPFLREFEGEGDFALVCSMSIYGILTHNPHGPKRRPIRGTHTTTGQTVVVTVIRKAV
jgi:hypothetical protein